MNYWSLKMPDLKSELEKLTLPSHFDDEPPMKTQETTKAKIVYDIVKGTPSLKRSDIAAKATSHGVSPQTAMAYVTQFMSAGVMQSKRFGNGGVATYEVIGPYVPPSRGNHVSKAKAVGTKMTVAVTPTLDVNNLKLSEARALYEQLKAIFDPSGR
jgi:hypothetical protein